MSMGKALARSFTVGLRVPIWGADCNNINKMLKKSISFMNHSYKTKLILPMGQITMVLSFPDNYQYQVTDNVIEIVPCEKPHNKKQINGAPIKTELSNGYNPVINE